MNFMSLNANGLGEDGKLSWIRNTKASNKVHFLCLQESQICDASKIKFQSIWGNNNFEKEAVNALGRSGGLVCIWNPQIFRKSNVVKDRNFIRVSGHLVGNNMEMHIFNIYAPQPNSAKAQLWDRLALNMEPLSGPTILLGDFNEVRFPSERMNSVFDQTAANSFNRFIHAMDLSEYHLCRKRFTYITKDLKKMSKLDRVLVSMDFMASWPNGTLSALDRGLSDHCPILLECNTVDFGPLPFRFFNSWLKHPHLATTVSHAIQNFNRPDLLPDRKLALKLKAIKEAIKSWRAIERDKEQDELILWLSQINTLELKAETTPLSNEEIQLHVDLKLKISLRNQ